MRPGFFDWYVNFCAPECAVWSQVYMDERLWIMRDELLMLRAEGAQDKDDGGKNQSDIKQYDQHRV